MAQLCLARFYSLTYLPSCASNTRIMCNQCILSHEEPNPAPSPRRQYHGICLLDSFRRITSDAPRPPNFGGQSFQGMKSSSVQSRPRASRVYATTCSDAEEHDAVHTRYMLHGAGLSSNTASVLCTPWGNIPQCANESTPIRAGRITHANPTRRLIYCPISSPWLHLFGQIPTDFQEEASQAFRIMSSLQAVLYKINQKSLD